MSVDYGVGSGGRRSNKSRQFDSFDLGDESLLDYSLSFVTSPSTSTLNKTTPSTSSLRKKTYCGLMSCPTEEVEEILYRPVAISDTCISYSTTDFLALGPQTRSSRRPKTKSRKVLARSSRTLKSCQKRLDGLRPILEYRISTRREWNSANKIEKIVNLSSMSPQRLPPDEILSCPFVSDNLQGIGFIENPDESIVLIGYTVKICPVAQVRNEELCENIGILPLPPNPKIGEYIFLEDSTAKIRLGLTRQSVNINDDELRFHEIVSGVVLAVLGYCSEGRFWVQDYIFPTPPSPQRSLSLLESEVEMVFVSGLNFGMSNCRFHEIDLLFDYLQGLCGSEAEQKHRMLKKTRVFFIGNLFSKPKRINHPDFREDLVDSNCDIANKLDYYLGALAETMEVFLVPGENEPTHQKILPQPPLHKQLFPNSMSKATFHCLTNPAKIHLSVSNAEDNQEDSIDNNSNNLISLVLSSGANVKETMANCEVDCPLEMCAKLLEWSHLHPTSSNDGQIADDIFTLTHLPHLFVLGGLADFSIKEWNGVNILGVPSFSGTGTIMVLTKSGDITPMSFKLIG